MSRLFRDATRRAAKVVNSTLGESCRYEHADGEVTEGVSIHVDQNKPVTDDYNMIVAYRVEASFVKDEIQQPRFNDHFVDPDGDRWRVGELVKETVGKWYFSVVRVG